MLKKIIWYSTVISTILTVGMIALMLRKPPVPPVGAGAEAAKSCEEKLASVAAASQRGARDEVRLTSEELNSTIQKSLQSVAQPSGPATLKQATVYMEGDQFIGVFNVDVKGVGLYLTVRGNLAYADHQVRLLPTQVKLGSLPVPVSWLRGKLNAQMELPEYVGGIRIENGEMVVQAQ